MLTVHNISKSYGLETVLKDISFNLNAGERMGLVGPNGCGKSTLLRIIAGLEKPERGSIRFTSQSASPAYLPQGFQFAAGETLHDFLWRRSDNPDRLAARLESVSAALVKQPSRKDLQQEYDDLLAALQSASEIEGQIPAILSALGLDDIPAAHPAQLLSGGQKTRLALAGVLLGAPNLLLLDEPTNHLDFDMLAWLEEWLLSCPHAVLLVSHDRTFLDRVAGSIMEIDPFTHESRQYAGGYSDYLEHKLKEHERRLQAYSDQQEEIARLQSAAGSVRSHARFRRGGKTDNNDKFAKGFFANRSLETMRRAKSIEKRIERLMNEDRIDRPQRSWQMMMDFGELVTSGRDVLSLENLSIGYGKHVLLQGLSLHIPLGRRVVLVGPNGCGKTTLLRTIAGVIPPLDGQVHLGANVHTGYMTQEQEDFDPALTVLQAIQTVLSCGQTEARSFLSKYLFTGDEVFVPVGSLSFGERARLSLAGLAARGCNFLLLDEPLNHLDIPSRSRLEQTLAAYQGTVLTVTHDRYFIEGFAQELWQVEEGRVQRILLHDE